MVLGYLVIGTLLGAAAAGWSYAAWDLALWWVALIHVAVGNLGTLGAAALHLLVRTGGAEAVAEPAEAVGDGV